MYRRDSMMNGTTERKDWSQLLASPQPGIQRNGLEKYENSLPQTESELHTQFILVHFLKIMLSPCTDTWNLLLKVYPLISYFLCFLKSKWAQQCQHFTWQGTLAASLCQWQTSLTHLSPSPCGNSSESFPTQHCQQLPPNEPSWERSGKLFAIPYSREGIIRLAFASELRILQRSATPAIPCEQAFFSFPLHQNGGLKSFHRWFVDMPLLRDRSQIPIWNLTLPPGPCTKQFTFSSPDAKKGEFEDPGKHRGSGKSIPKDRQATRTHGIP